MHEENPQPEPGQRRRPPAGQFAGSLFAGLPWLELGLAVCTIAVILGGAADLIALLVRQEAPLSVATFSAQFEETLSALLLLVVGVSMATMLLLRKPENVIDVMFFVIARRVLIKTHGVHELLLAVGAIAGLFAVRKYLMGRSAEPSKEDA